MVQATEEVGNKPACLRCGDEIENGALCERCDEELSTPYCGQHVLPIGPSGLCAECESEAYAERCGEHGVVLNADGSCPECDQRFEATDRPKPAATTPAQKPHYSTLEFPRDAMVGSIGDLARLLAKGTEVPEEFYFAAGLTVV